MASISKGRLVLHDRALRVHPYRDARVFGRAAAWSLLACVALVVLGFLLPGPVQIIPGLLAAALITLGVGFAVAAVPVWLMAAWGASRRRASVRVSDAIYLEHAGRRSSVALSAVRGARLRRGGRALTLSTDQGLALTVSLADRDEARRLLDAIAEGGAGRTWQARVYTSVSTEARQGLAAAFAALIALVAGVGANFMVGVTLSALAGITFWVLAEIADWPCRRADLVVGNDGVAIRRGGRERFLPLASITGVAATEHGIALALAGGERLDFALTPPAIRRPALDEETPQTPALTGRLAALRRARLLAILREHLGGRGAEESGAVTSGAVSLLGRRGRPLPLWREHLRAQVSKTGGSYRIAALSPDQALCVLQDGRASVEARIGAAMALSAGEDHRSARKLRAAIAASASEEVRAALEQAAEGELEEATLARARMAGGEAG